MYSVFIGSKQNKNEILLTKLSKCLKPLNLHANSLGNKSQILPVLILYFKVAKIYQKFESQDEDLIYLFIKVNGLAECRINLRALFAQLSLKKTYLKKMHVYFYF